MYNLFYCVCIFLGFSFSCKIFAQSNVKSGNIRSCEVWGNTVGNLQDINIINNTTITSNTTTTTLSSSTLEGSNSVLELNGTDAINFVSGGTTSKSLCGYNSNTTIANVTTFPGTGTSSNQALILSDASVTVSSDVTTDQTLVLRYKVSFGLKKNYFCSNPSLTLTANNFFLDIRIWKNGVFQTFDASGSPCFGFSTYDGSTHTTFFGDVVESEAYRYTDINVTGKANDIFLVSIRMYPDRFNPGTSCSIPTFGDNLYHQYCASGSIPVDDILLKTKVEVFRSPTF